MTGEPWIEAVPNLSEGRDPTVVEDAARAVEAAGAKVLDRSSDPDHNRSVLTFAGPPSEVAEAAFQVVALAAERIDLRRHEGVHPRIGACDVLPFVPLRGWTRAQCVPLAHAVGARVGRELGIPVYFYGDAARRPERRELPLLRRGGLEALRAALGRDPERAPDEGPLALHPTAGAIAVGVRPFLVAFNVELETDDLTHARAIAREIREAGGGLPGIRALGLPLASAGITQVSTNVCDPDRTGLVEVFEAVERRARERGISVRGSELVGLAPRSVLDEGIARRVRLRDFDPRRQVLEEVLARTLEPHAP